MIEIETFKNQINSEIPISYHHLNQSTDKPLLLFFHGYSDSAKGLLRRALPDLDDRYEILAINGLFPVPQKKDNEWKQAFAWYFADFTSNSVLIHPEVSAKAVVHLIHQLGLTKRPKILIGFSQGGFFLPFLMPSLENVLYLVAIGAAYRTEDYAFKLNVPLDAIHGTADEVIPFELSKKSFERLVAQKNPLGQYYQFEGLRHTMNDESRHLLKNKIDEVIKGASTTPV